MVRAAPCHWHTFLPFSGTPREVLGPSEVGIPVPSPRATWRAPGCGNGIQGGPSSPHRARQRPLQSIFLPAILAGAGLYLHNIWNMIKRIVPQSDTKVAKHIQNKHAPKDVAAASFPLSWWNHSFMFMLIREIYKCRKGEKKTPHHLAAVDEFY